MNSSFKFALWNVRSLCNKLPDLMEHILDNNPDIVLLTETWLGSDKNSITAEIKTYGFELFHDRRKNRAKEKDGGVGVMVKANKSAKQVAVKQYSTFEHTIVKLSRKNSKILFIITIYRLQSESISIFFDEFAELLDLYAVSNEDFVIAGDVNIHVETDSLYSTKFREVLNLYNLKQHVQGPTHREGHTVDVIITPNHDSYLRNSISQALT